METLYDGLTLPVYYEVPLCPKSPHSKMPETRFLVTFKTFHFPQSETFGVGVFDNKCGTV